MAAVGNYEVISGTVNLAAGVETVISAPAGKKVLWIASTTHSVPLTYPSSDGSGGVIWSPSGGSNVAYRMVVAEMG
ncbi:hypothetical protein SEA_IWOKEUPLIKEDIS_17 [Mycobacterium phage Iwokeuplikedis]|nr:hypothetical protein SEA_IWOKEUPLIKEDIS_17 [Mycobacterium phage Iwokeuplikedis]